LKLKWKLGGYVVVDENKMIVYGYQNLQTRKDSKRKTDKKKRLPAKEKET